jgi:hypothetical protein
MLRTASVANLRTPCNGEFFRKSLIFKSEFSIIPNKTNIEYRRQNIKRRGMGESGYQVVAIRVSGNQEIYDFRFFIFSV